VRFTTGGRAHPVPLDDDRCGPTLSIARSAINAAEQHLRGSPDDKDHERVVYLGGLSLGVDSVVMTVMIPHARTTSGSFRTDTDANADVVHALIRHGLVLVGQVHTHPGTWVDHSDGDDEGALVRFEGFWSIVVPSYCREGMGTLARCGVHVFRTGAFRRLTERAVRARVRIAPTDLDLRHGFR
jgi:proteasome lid subunit RPN8/RPN11